MRCTVRPPSFTASSLNQPSSKTSNRRASARLLFFGGRMQNEQMTVRARRRWIGAEGRVEKGQILTVSLKRGRQLLQAGKAEVYVGPEEVKQPAPVPPVAPVDPVAAQPDALTRDEAQTFWEDGQKFQDTQGAGEATQSSSSQADQASAETTSSESEGAGASSSTTAIDSQQTQMFSTPATSDGGKSTTRPRASRSKASDGQETQKQPDATD